MNYWLKQGCERRHSLKANKRYTGTQRLCSSSSGQPKTLLSVIPILLVSDQSQKKTNGAANGFNGEIDWERYVSKSLLFY